MINRNFWLSLPSIIRKRLATTLEIPRSGNTEVFGGQVTHDGYTDKDLSTVTLKKLQDFVFDTKSDNFDELLTILITRLSNPIVMELVPEKEEKTALNPEVTLKSSMLDALLDENQQLRADNKALQDKIDASDPSKKFLYATAPIDKVLISIPNEEPKKNKGGRPKKGPKSTK